MENQKIELETETNQERTQVVTDKTILIWFIGSIVSFIISIIMLVFFVMVALASESVQPFLFGFVICGLFLVISFILMIFSVKKNRNNKLGMISKVFLILLTLSLLYIGWSTIILLFVA